MFFELVLEVGEVAISGHRGQAAEGVLRSFWRGGKKLWLRELPNAVEENGWTD